jgi:hypothetical protein
MHSSVEVDRVDLLYRAQSVNPGSSAQTTIFEPDADLYRVDVKRVMAWEYGKVTNRNDWNFDQDR